MIPVVGRSLTILTIKRLMSYVPLLCNIINCRVEQTIIVPIVDNLDNSRFKP